MEITKEFAKRASKKLLLARARLLQNNGFYGNLLMHMKFSINKEIETVTATDNKIIFNPEFIMKISDKEIEYVLMHMITHVALRHYKRIGNFDKDTFFEACDIVVNSNILYSEDMDEESISIKDFGGVQPHLAPDGTEGYLHSVEDLIGMMSKGGKEEGNGNGNSKNNSSGWDQHNTEEDSLNSESTEYDDDWLNNVLNAAAIAQKRDEIRILEGSKTRGTVPLFAKRILEEFTKPKVDWRTVLDEFVQVEVNDYTFNPPDRRYTDGDFFLPDFNEKDDAVENVLFMIDTSGSMSEKEVTACYSEIKGAIDQFDGKLKGWLGFFDYKVIPPKRFEDEDEFKVIRPIGGGGTSFENVFKYVKAHINEIEPVSIIILTDGYAPFPEESAALSIPVLWIINNDKVTPPWGKVARI